MVQEGFGDGCFWQPYPVRFNHAIAMNLSRICGIEKTLTKTEKCYARNCGSNLFFQQGLWCHRFHFLDLESRYRFTASPVSLHPHRLHSQLQALSRQRGIRPDPYG